MRRSRVTTGPIGTHAPFVDPILDRNDTIVVENGYVGSMDSVSSAVGRGRTGMGRYDGRKAYRDNGGSSEFAKFTNLRTSPTQVNLRGAR